MFETAMNGWNLWQLAAAFAASGIVGSLIDALAGRIPILKNDQIRFVLVLAAVLGAFAILHKFRLLMS